MFWSKKSRTLYAANTQLVKKNNLLQDEINQQQEKINQQKQETNLLRDDNSTLRGQVDYLEEAHNANLSKDKFLEDQNNQLWRDNYLLRGRLSTLQDNLPALYLHTEPYCHWYEWDDLSRLYRAINEPITVLSIDEVSAKVKSGSTNSTYNTTLHSCNCRDHQQFPNEPCKHMYALAWQLGLLRETAPHQLESLSKVNDNNEEISKALGTKERRDILMHLLRCMSNLEAVTNTYAPFKYNSTNVQLHNYISTELDTIDAMNGFSFEQYCCDLLTAIGFETVFATQKSGDFGVDIFANKDFVSFAIQCKRLHGNVGNDAVQEIYTAKEFYHRDVGVVITNSTFSTAATAIAEKTGVRLWNRDTLKRFLMIRWMRDMLLHTATA